ncbi:SET domain-containing protein [Pleurotus pulmonarius]
MDKHNDEEIRGDTVELDSDPQAPKVYRIQAIPSKGLGVVAAIDLAPGDLIIVESPLFLFRPEGAMIYKDLLQRAFDKLDDGKKEAFMKLDNAHPETEYPPLVGIFNTNAYDVQKSDHADSDVDSPYIAVFNDISRINHSCSPNTIRLWRASSSTMHISACRAIPAGTELTTHYRDPLLPSSDRGASLLAIYKFVCACPACLNPTASDKARLRLQQSRGRLADVAAWARAAPPSPEFLADTLELLGLVQEEGLESQHVYGRVLRHLMCMSYVMGEGDGMAEGYEGYRRMLRAWRLANGAEEEEVERVEQADVEMMRAAISRRNTDS